MSQPKVSRFMEKLLDGVEVEWKALGNVSDIKRGTSITKKTVIEGDVPVIAGGRTPAYYHNVSNREGQTIVIAGSGAYAGFVSWWEQPIFVSDAFTVKPNRSLLPRYCYHFLLNMQQQLHEFKSGGGVPHVYPRNVAPIQIPIPCPDNPEKSLEIQAEIVRILDAFTAMTTELTAELNLRQQQYNYYRDQLLSFEELSREGCEWRSVEEVFNLKNGYTPSKSNKSYWEDGTIPWFRMEDLRENGSVLNDSLQKISISAVKGDLFPENSIIISTSATIGEHALVTVPYLSNQRFTNLSLKTEYEEKFDIEFLYYYCYLLGEWCRNNTTKSSFASVDMNGFRKIKIPIPPLAEQARIVAILDKFDTLTTSIKEGLPREIALRRQQYEYYRDKLLSFPRPSDEQVTGYE